MGRPLVICKLIVRALIVLALVCVLSGCAREQVASGLDQRQAREMVATLTGQGIISYALTDRGSRGSFSVEVASRDYPLAVSILNALGLPKEQPPSFRELTEQKGFLPNTREVEAARLDYALGSEIEEKLRSLDGIDSARVIVRSNMLRAAQEPSASIMITTRAGVTLEPKEIVQVVTLVVPGLIPSRIAVLIQQARSTGVKISDQAVQNNEGRIVYRPLVPFLGVFMVPEGEGQRLAGAILGLLILATGVAFAGGYIFAGKKPMRPGYPSASSVMISKLGPEKGSGRIRISSSINRIDGGEE